MRLTDGKGVNVLYDNIANPKVLPQAFMALGFRGRLVTAGAHGGPNVTINFAHLYHNQITIIGRPGHQPADLPKCFAAAAEGKIKPQIERIMPLSQAAEAHRLMEIGRGDRQDRARPDAAVGERRFRPAICARASVTSADRAANNGWWKSRPPKHRDILAFSWHPTGRERENEVMLNKRHLLAGFALTLATAPFMAAVAPVAALDKAPFDAKAFEDAQAAGKPILVEVTAPWCPTLQGAGADPGQTFKHAQVQGHGALQHRLRHAEGSAAPIQCASAEHHDRLQGQAGGWPLQRRYQPATRSSGCSRSRSNADMGSVALAFLAGVLSTLSPCVLPLLPIVLGTAVSAHRAGPVALAAGLALSFVIVGLFIATIGFSIGLDAGVFRAAAAILLMAIGLVLLVPRFQAQFALAAGPVSQWTEQRFGGFSGNGLGGQFGVGLLLGAVWSPCVGPTLGAASLLAAQGRTSAMSPSPC